MATPLEKSRVLNRQAVELLASSMLYMSLMFFIVVVGQFKLIDCQRSLQNEFKRSDTAYISASGEADANLGQQDQVFSKQYPLESRTVYQDGPKGQDLSSSYLNDQSSILDQCCACDEAKYELVFEGLWSKYTHPDDFPENYWLAYFSDIIGASHSNDFRMWHQDALASEGVKELAETGSTKKLESELKQVSSKTRTIIKARELRYPTLNSKTSAVFRTDRQHHLVSILSKLGPSPDWMVGVSGLELCQTDCSWAPQRVVNLYLWDAGTDSGTSFTSTDSPTHPQDRIQLFRKSHQRPTKSVTGGLPARKPVHYQGSSDDTGFLGADYSSTYTHEQSKPFAQLTITRQRIYEKSCNSDSPPPVRVNSLTSPNKQPSSWTDPTRVSFEDCSYTEWSDWSICSSICGKGIRARTRNFDNERSSETCSRDSLIEKEICLSECIGNTTCVTRDWSEWSRCSVDCGQGLRKRTRSPIGTMKKACESVELAEMEVCVGDSGINCSSESSPCELTEWSPWSACSSACGRGKHTRTRQYKRKEDIENCTAKLTQTQSCSGSPQCKQVSSKDTIRVCSMPVAPGSCKARFRRWYYDVSGGRCRIFDYGGCDGNANNFDTFRDCHSFCRSPMNHSSIDSDFA